jgi:thiamine-phosphate pyrophosphorylase
VTPRLVAITDRQAADAETTLARFAELGYAARPATVAFQLRDLELPARERLLFGRALLRIARAAGQWLIVNDRIDIAVILGAEGVHLGEAGIATADARRLLGRGGFVTRACHDPTRASEIDADALLLSPIFEAKKGLAPLGTAGVKLARRSLADARAPAALLALGGVTSERASRCIAEGAAGVAVVGAVLRGEGRALVRALGIQR